ncbi:MAG TPA: hypothetical protein VI753_05590 [Anaerolineales bacterium]|nr:hypothetical protein [Anaerolineales bacterium]
MNEQQHEMVLEKTHPSGAEEWYCPTCGRRILLRVPSTNGMVVVEPGSGSTENGRTAHVGVPKKRVVPAQKPEEQQLADT